MNFNINFNINSRRWIAAVTAATSLIAAISGIQMGRADAGLAQHDFTSYGLANVVYILIVAALFALSVTARQREDNLDVLYAMLVVLLPIATGNAAWVATVYLSANSNALIEGAISGSLALTLTAVPLSFYAGTRLNRKPARQQQQQQPQQPHQPQQQQQQQPQHHQKPQQQKPRDHQPREHQSRNEQ